MKCEGGPGACKRCRQAKVECRFIDSDSKTKEESTLEQRTLKLEKRFRQLESDKIISLESRLAFVESELFNLRHTVQHSHRPQQLSRRPSVQLAVAPDPSSRTRNSQRHGTRVTLPPISQFSPDLQPIRHLALFSLSSPASPNQTLVPSSVEASPHTSGRVPRSPPSMFSHTTYSTQSSPTLTPPSPMLTEETSPCQTHSFVPSRERTMPPSSLQLLDDRLPRKLRRMTNDKRGLTLDSIIALDEAEICIEAYVENLPLDRHSADDLPLPHRYFQSTLADANMFGGGPVSNAEMCDLMRLRSSLMLHTLVTIGAGIIKHNDTFLAGWSKIEQLLDVDATQGELSSLWDLKALVLIVTYFGRRDLLPRVINLAGLHRLPQAFDELFSDSNARSDRDEEATVERGRLWLMIWLNEKFYTTLLDEPGTIKTLPAVVEHRASLLRTSRFTRPHVDLFLCSYIENLVIISRAQDKFSPANQPHHMTDTEIVSTIKGYLYDLDVWWSRWGDWLDAATKVGGDTTRSRSPIHYARFTILHLFFSIVPSSPPLLADHLRLSYAAETIQEGIRCLDNVSFGNKLHSPIAVHFITVTLSILPSRIAALALRFPQTSFTPILRCFRRIISMLAPSPSNPPTSWPVDALSSAQVGKLEDLIAQLEMARPEVAGDISKAETRSPSSSRSLKRENEDGLFNEQFDMAFWHEVITNVA
ncbi:hypothetical protein P7C70_g4185, partial [Phenoliferia sp. Uapishka_3]